jgi:hypothetical protein
MNRIKLPILLIATLLIAVACNNPAQKKSQVEASKNDIQTKNLEKLPKGISNYVSKFLAEEDTISIERKAELKTIAQHIEKLAKASSPINLTFICTHNSRRSHLSQIWAQSAAVYFGIPKVHCFSGGT